MSELNIPVLNLREKMLFSGEIYTTGKNFTLPLGVTGVTNSTSVISIQENLPNLGFPYFVFLDILKK